MIPGQPLPPVAPPRFPKDPDGVTAACRLHPAHPTREGLNMRHHFKDR